MLQEAISMAKSGEIDVLIFDEFQAAYAHGLLDKETAKDFILKKTGDAGAGADRTKS